VSQSLFFSCFPFTWLAAATLECERTLTYFPYDLDKDASFARSFVRDGPILKLQICEGGFSAYRDRAPRDAASRVVALIGKTHAGKSHLGKELLSRGGYETASGLPSPSEGNFAQLEPTTGDCRFFQGAAGKKVLTVLDMEGEDAGDQLPIEIRDKLAPGTSLEEYCKARRSATSEHLPRLAYAVADVLVYVTTGSLSQNDVVRDLERIGQSCTEGVTRAYPPSLVVVQNKQPGDEVKQWLDDDPQNTILLHSWMNTHSGERHIKPFFDTVSVVLVPACGMRDKELYEDATKKFVALIEEVLDRRTEVRCEQSLLLTPLIWIHMFANIVKTFHAVKGLNVDQSYLSCILLRLQYAAHFRTA
jgi:hypothetical protein